MPRAPAKRAGKGLFYFIIIRAGIFIKQRCQKGMDGGMHGLLITRHLRKPGQSQYDPQSGKETTNQFESNMRFELIKMK